MDSNSFDRVSRGLAGTTSRRQALKFLGGGLAGGLLAGTGFAGLQSAAARPVRGSATGTLDDGTDLGTITGLVASLTQDGILVAGNSSTIGPISGLLEVAGSAAQSSCDILFLDLLGLQIEITAVPGAGNLLGNLLCAVAGLLDRGGPLQGIVGLLNNIFRNLG